MLNRYQTRPIVTLLWFAGVAGLLVYGLIHLLHFHHSGGAFVVASAFMVFATFNKRYARNTENELPL